MKLLKLPIINAMFIVLMSVVYSFLFIFTSNHIEFLGLISNDNTLQSKFWNGWSEFIRAGNMKYVGYSIIILAFITIIFMLLKQTKRYDEYQIGILLKNLIVAGILSILMMPIIMILLLSDPSYAIETIFLFAVVQWLCVLIIDLIYVIKY